MLSLMLWAAPTFGLSYSSFDTPALQLLVCKVSDLRVGSEPTLLHGFLPFALHSPQGSIWDLQLAYPESFSLNSDKVIQKLPFEFILHSFMRETENPEGGPCFPQLHFYILPNFPTNFPHGMVYVNLAYSQNDSKGYLPSIFYTWVTCMLLLPSPCSTKSYPLVILRPMSLGFGISQQGSSEGREVHIGMN